MLQVTGKTQKTMIASSTEAILSNIVVTESWMSGRILSHGRKRTGQCQLRYWVKRVTMAPSRAHLMGAI